MCKRRFGEINDSIKIKQKGQNIKNSVGVFYLKRILQITTSFLQINS